MKLFTLYALFISFGMALLPSSAFPPITHVQQEQPPGVYPHNTYTAAYVRTQTVPGRKSSTHAIIVSSDGKGHLASGASSVTADTVIDLPAGKLYRKRDPFPGESSTASYGEFSYLNEVMFDAVTGTPPDPAPKAIGSKSIDKYQCNGWRLTTDYKIEEWWFDRQSKCLVLYEEVWSKPNSNLSKKNLLTDLENIFSGGAVPKLTITERLESFRKDPLPISYFDTKGLCPIKMIVLKKKGKDE